MDGRLTIESLNHSKLKGKTIWKRLRSKSLFLGLNDKFESVKPSDPKKYGADF